MDTMLRCDSPSDGNGTKTILLPQPTNFKDLLLQLTSGTLTAAQLPIIRVLANGKPVIDTNGLTLDAINQVDKCGAFAADDVFRIPFGLMGAKDPALADITGMNVGTPNPKSGSVIKSLQLQFNAAGGAAPTFALGANVSDPDPNGPGIGRKLLTYQLQVAANADTILTLPQVYGGPEQAYIRRVFLKAPTGVIASARLQVAGVPKWDSNLAWSNRLLTDSLVRDIAAATNYFNMIMEFPPDAVSGRMGAGKNVEDLPYLNVLGAAQLNRSIQIVVNSSVSEIIEITVESLGAAPGL